MRTSGDIVLRVRASTGRMLATGLRLTRGAVKPSGQEAITVLRTAKSRQIEVTISDVLLTDPARLGRAENRDGFVSGRLDRSTRQLIIC